MSRYSLAALTGAQRPRRRTMILIRPILQPATQSANLYALAYRPIIARLDRAITALIAAYPRPGFRDAAGDDIAAIISDMTFDLQRLLVTIAPGLRSWANRLERQHRGRWRGAVLTATGVDLDTLLVANGLPQTVQQAIDWNTSLITSVSDEGRTRIGNIVFAGIQANRVVTDVARDLREAVSMTRRRALGIVADQSKKLATALDKERMAEAGIEKFKYRHSGKIHPRTRHLHRDGKTYELVSGREVDGPDVIVAGDGPGEPPFCGCRRQALLEL